MYLAVNRCRSFQGFTGPSAGAGAGYPRTRTSLSRSWKGRRLHKPRNFCQGEPLISTSASHQSVSTEQTYLTLGYFRFKSDGRYSCLTPPEPMAKRKREDEPGASQAPNVEDENFKLQASRLKATVRQGAQALHDALKFARGFERQKLGRRQKTATREPQTLLRLREEVIILKQLQLEKTAKTQLLKICARIKRIKEHPTFIRVYGSNPTFDSRKPGAEANVIGRLFSSDPVKQVLPKITKSIYAVLDIPQLTTSTANHSAESVVKSTRKTSISVLEEGSDGASRAGLAAHTHDQGGQLSGPDSGDDEFLEYAKGRLASTDGESDNEAISNHSISLQRDRSPSHDDASSRMRDFSMSPTHSEVSGSDREVSTAPQTRQPVSQTAFLPSLSMGGYYSGSESEDERTQYHGPALPKPRKNRRGQRERQKLAELKHGKNAKHIGKKAARDDRSAGWDPKRGATHEGDHPRDRTRKGGHSQNASGSKSTTTQSQPTRAKQQNLRDDQGPIHPSWEAAKRRKMQDQQQASFQGKKITFD